MHPKKKIRNISLNEGVDACGNIALIWNVSAANAAYIQVISFFFVLLLSVTDLSGFSHDSYNRQHELSHRLF